MLAAVVVEVPVDGDTIYLHIVCIFILFVLALFLRWIVRKVLFRLSIINKKNVR
jgi:hypothetical protein